MDFLLYILLAMLVLAPIIGLLMKSSLKSKFRSLGDMRGKTYFDIVNVVGQPVTRQNYNDGYVCVWQSTTAGGSYQISIAFDYNNKFIGIQNEVDI